MGLLLLGAAVYAVAWRGQDAVRAWHCVRAAPAGLIALALVLPLANIAVTSMSFWVQMRRFGPVGPGEMTALIGSAWLLNYLPLRPGMLGRLAYHKAVNGISIVDSVRAMFVGMAMGAVAVLVVLGVSVAAGPGHGPVVWWLALGGPFLVAAVAAVFMRRSGNAWLAVVFLCRYADMLIWAFRYWVVFRLIGEPIGIPQSAAVAAVCQVMLNIPVTGNGMGLREWAVGLTASRLPPGLFGATGKLQMAAGLSADLVNRIAELAVAVPTGLVCAAWVARRLRRESTAGPSSKSSPG